MKIIQEQLLFDCLEAFEAGESVESLVEKHPHAAAEIEAFLAVAVHLQQMDLQPNPAAKERSQQAFLTQAAQMKTRQRQDAFTWQRLRRFLLPLASLATVLILFAVTSIFASATALPGDVLYNTKLGLESFRLNQAADATAVFTLRSQMDQERVREVKAILRTSQTVDVSFEGRINTKQGSNWIIAGTPVTVNEQTQIEGNTDFGALVLVNGRIQDGQLFASSIVVIEEVPTPPTVTQTPTQDPPTPTAVPETPTSAPPTPVPDPTGTPPVDNENDNDGDDNSNDNAGMTTATTTAAMTTATTTAANDNGNDNDGDDNGNDNDAGQRQRRQ